MNGVNSATGPETAPATWKLGALIAVVILVLDQASKWWIVTSVMAPPREIAVTPFFNLVMVWNRGVTFGLFGDAPDTARWFLAALSLIIVVVLGVWLTRAARIWVEGALGGVIGGALGNVIDRFHYGAVADFLDVHVAGWHWPAFNIADSAIVVGVGLLLLDAFFVAKE
jgi:signal peptidase II